jgi:AcrR family transcriptional regulator
MPIEALAQSEPPQSQPESIVAESGEFPRSVNWSNPRVAAILETAAACFSKGGFTATTLADIGKELGLRKSIVHYYFASKAALVHEVQSFAYGRFLDGVRKTLSGGGGLGALWVTLRNASDLRGLSIELWSEGRRDPELAERANVLQDEIQRQIADQLRSTRHSASADELALLSLAVLDGLTVLAERDGNDERAGRAYSAYMKLLGL